MGVTVTLHLRLLSNLKDIDHYKLAVCHNPNNNAILLETQALKNNEIYDINQDLVELNLQTEWAIWLDISSTVHVFLIVSLLFKGQGLNLRLQILPTRNDRRALEAPNHCLHDQTHWPYHQGTHPRWWHQAWLWMLQSLYNVCQNDWDIKGYHLYLQWELPILNGYMNITFKDKDKMT